MLKPVLVTACIVLAAQADTANAAGLEFSADTVQSGPGQEMRSGKVYVGAGGTRFEYQQQGRPVVQIILPAKGIMRILYPLDRVYMEFKGGPGAAKSNARPNAPCTPGPRHECKRDGDATIAGQKAERWSIGPKGAPAQVRIWWDKRRKMPLREEYADGRVMQAIMRGTEQYENRQVESWEFTYMAPNGRFRRAVSLIAPDLGLAVVERMPGGLTRQLRNITLGAPDAKLFELPAGYKRVEPPKPPAMPRQLQSGQPRRDMMPRGSNGGPMMGRGGMGPAGTQPSGQMGQMMYPPRVPAAPPTTSDGGGNPK